jgi:hypothetical protein
MKEMSTMQVNRITLPSYGGRDLSLKHIINNNSSLAVFFPGQNYSCELPLLYYTSKSAFSNGYDLLMLEYGYQSARSVFEPEKVELIITECYDSISKLIENYESICFVSKSLGTYISGKTADLFPEMPIRHIFLTPINSSIPLINKYGGFVICGTKDEVFAENEIKQVEGFMNTTIHKIEGANHGLEVEDLQESLMIMKTLVDLTSRFFKA